MSVYTNSGLSASVTWPGLIEPIWQILPGRSQSLPSWKRTDIGLSERLFIGAVLNLSKEFRQWGIVSWLAETMCLSRPTLYAIGKWTKAGLLPPPNVAVDLAKETRETATSDGKKMVLVTPNRIKRTTLSLELPGGASGRAAKICLQTAFGESRSPAFQSGLAREAGRQAGETWQQRKVIH